MRLLGTTLLVLASMLLLACAQSEPDARRDFIKGFETKMAVLLKHIDNANEIMEGDATFVASGRQVSGKTRYRRYKHVGPAAKAVFDHFANPSMALYVQLTSASEIDPAWRNEVKTKVETARNRLANSIANFRKSMPREPQPPEQSSEVGSLAAEMCARGSLYSMSEMCRKSRGDYGYTKDDRLYFYAESGGILIERLLDLDIDDWLLQITRAKVRSGPEK